MIDYLEARLNEWLRLRLTATGSSLLTVEFPPFESPGGRENPRNPILAEACRQLQAYLDGDLRRFDLPLDPAGTPFQKQVWQQLLTIPYGETRSYREVAQTIGAPRAVRAVGAANGANPIAIVIPCHRVIGSSGKLVGYGGGLDLKRRLLALEKSASFALPLAAYSE